MTACSPVLNLTGIEEAESSSRLSGRKKSFSARFKASLKQLIKSSFKRDICTGRHRSYGPGEIQQAAGDSQLAVQLRFPGHCSATGLRRDSFTLSARCAGGGDLRRGDADDVHNLPESARSSSACASVFSTHLSAAADWDAPARSGSSFLGAFSTPERAAATALENESPQSAPGRLSSSPEATHQQHPSQPPSGYHRAYSNVHRPRRPVQVVVVLEEDEEDEEDDGRDGGYSPHRALTMPSLSTPACAPPSRAASSTLAWAEAGGAASRSPRPTYSPAGCPPSATHGSGTASRRGSSGAVTTGGEATTGGMTPAAYVAAMRLRGTTGGMAGGGGGGTVNRSPSVTGERRRPSLSRFGITETAAGRSMSMTLVRQASLGGPGLSVTTGSPSSTSAGAYGGSLGGRCGGTGAAAGGVAAGAFSNRAVSLPAVSSFSSLRAAFLTGGSSLVPAAAAVTEPAAASAAAPESHDADTVPRVDAMHADTCCVHAAPALVSTCTPELAACGAGLMSLSSGEREA